MSRNPYALNGNGNGNGDYRNGYNDSDPYLSSRVGQLRDPSNDSSSRSRERAEEQPSRRAGRPGGYGGYGGFGDIRNYQPSPVGKPAELERRRANRRSGDKDKWNNSRSRSRPEGSPGVGDGTRQMEDVLGYIDRQWAFMTERECVPVQIALKLLDTSSLGLANQYGQFKDTNQQLHDALKTIVNEHHQGFNSSIGTFHKIQSSIQASQARVRDLKESLVQARFNLSTTKPELKGFATTSQNYDDMLQLLALIEEVQLVPEKLEGRISEKRFISAVEVLQDALRLIRRSDMENIGALSDLRVYLSNQEHSLTDILIEELHSHLYLKSPYCENRWKVHTQAQSKGGGSDAPSSILDSGRRHLYEFLDGLDTSAHMTEDVNRNPEADTFRYIQLILESLNKMGRLETAMESIEQRMPVELFRIVEKSNTEVDQRHPSSLRGFTSTQQVGIEIITSGTDARSRVLRDLLWTIYTKFEAIAEGHRAVHDIVAGISRRDGFGDTASMTGNFKELWKLYQNEIKSLLHDYLATDGGYGAGTSGERGGSVFQRSQRDRAKKMFKLADLDDKATELATEREDLEAILKSSVPGLVSDSRKQDGVVSTDTNTLQDGSATGHKLLIDPTVFNMGVLLPPSLTFLDRLKEIVPPGPDIIMSTLTSFLDDFLVNVFQPQLDETLMDLCAQIFVELDAFQTDAQWESYAQKPIFKGTIRFYNLVSAVCTMLSSLPHDQAFSQLIITQMSTYFDKCRGWFKAMVSRPQFQGGGGRTLKAAAFFAESGDLSDVVSALSDPSLDGAAFQQLIDKEVEHLILSTRERPLEDSDLVSDRKNIAALCLLYTSMKWLGARAKSLRYISHRAVDSSRSTSRSGPKRRWTALGSSENSPISDLDDRSAYLPLNPETAQIFDSVVNNYHYLADLVLRTLHLELRVHTLHHLTSSLAGAYALSSPVGEPDPGILTLNADLNGFDEELSTYFRLPQRRFVTTGLGVLMDALLLHAAARVNTMNEHGCGRMQLDILVLQQNLKNIEPAASLHRSAEFFALFSQGPDAVVGRAKEAQAAREKGEELGAVVFSYDEMKVLVELCYSEAVRGDKRDVAVSAKRAMDDHLLQLSEYMWQT
ncbi:hypothetical protein EV356DRAFT_479326 [Viridothelium virens]|uniref:Exocyst complex component Sec8 n=1 Tax=Viridothelium virens TaxID=1048519 RepID=A0A6A6HMJ8_VIRVR|nr:hypothetical protein EV356DRAFT_479326 [Viridothelium virens]